MQGRPFPGQRGVPRRGRQGVRTMGAPAKTFLRPGQHTISAENEETSHVQAYQRSVLHGRNVQRLLLPQERQTAPQHDFSTLVLPPPEGALGELSAPASSASTSAHAKPASYPQFTLNFELQNFLNAVKQTTAVRPLTSSDIVQSSRTAHTPTPAPIQDISQTQRNDPLTPPVQSNATLQQGRMFRYVPRTERVTASQAQQSEPETPQLATQLSSVVQTNALVSKSTELNTVGIVNPYANDSDNFDSDNDEDNARPPVKLKMAQAPVLREKTPGQSYAGGARVQSTGNDLSRAPGIVAAAPVFDDSMTVATHALPNSVNLIRDARGQIRVEGRFGSALPAVSSGQTSAIGHAPPSVAPLPSLQSDQETYATQRASLEQTIEHVFSKLSTGMEDSASSNVLRRASSSADSKKCVPPPGSGFLEALLQNYTDEASSSNTDSDDGTKKDALQKEMKRVSLADVAGVKELRIRLHRQPSPFAGSLLRQHSSGKEHKLFPPSVSYSTLPVRQYGYTFQWNGVDGVVVKPGSLSEEVGRIQLPHVAVNSLLAITGLHALTLRWMHEDVVQVLSVTLQYWELPNSPNPPSTASPESNVVVSAQQSMRALRAALYDSDHKLLYTGATKDYTLEKLCKKEHETGVLCCDIPILDNVFFLRLRFLPNVDLQNQFAFAVELMPLLKKDMLSTQLKRIKITCT